MEAALASIRENVRLISGAGTPAQVRAASEQLVLLQRRSDLLPVLGTLLDEALQAQNDALAFFIAQTLASRARMGIQPAPAGASCNTQALTLGQHLLLVLSAAAKGERRVPAVVVRQLCVALACLCVWLLDAWPDAVSRSVGSLASGGNPEPLLEFLMALAEEPFDRRLGVQNSQRSRFALELRGQVLQLLEAAGRCCVARPGPVPLKVLAAWLAAQSSFENWLPMIGFAAGTHPALAGLVPVREVLARCASGQLGLECLQATVEVLEAALPLCQDLSSPEAAQTVAPLLQAFAETCASLPSRAPAPSATFADGSLADGVISLTAATHAALSSRAVLRSSGAAGVLAMATRLLVLSSPRGGLEGACVGDGLLARSLEVWEALADTGREALSADDHAQLRPAMDAGFRELLSSLPEALVLPAECAELPEGWPQLRSRVPQLLISWCDGNEARVAELLACLRARLGQLGGIGVSNPAQLAALEGTLTLASSCAKVLADVQAGDAAEIPDVLGALLAELPGLPLSSLPAPWRELVSGAVAEFVVDLDPWITQQRFSLSSPAAHGLLALVVGLCGNARLAAGSEALIVVVSNLAPALAADAEVGGAVCGKLEELCFGASGLSPGVRERLVRSAWGPVLSQLPAARLGGVVEGLAARLRGAACGSGGDAEVAARLLFQLISAPEAAPEVSLQWLSHDWAAVEAALGPRGSDASADAACNAVVALLSRARRLPAAAEALRRSLPLLAACATSKACAVTALASLLRVFRGGADEASGGLLAAALGEVLRGLSPAPMASPEYLASLLEMLCTALAPRGHLVPQLLGGPAAASFAAALQGSLPMVSQSRSPKAVCWGLLIFDRLPHWLQLPQTQAPMSQLVTQLIPSAVACCCRLLATSPLAQDIEVSSALAKGFLVLVRARPEESKAAVVQFADSAGISAEEVDLLMAQIGGSHDDEETLAPQLRDTATDWQAEELRRSLLA